MARPEVPLPRDPPSVQLLLNFNSNVISSESLIVATSGGKRACFTEVSVTVFDSEDVTWTQGITLGVCFIYRLSECVEYWPSCPVVALPPVAVRKRILGNWAGEIDETNTFRGKLSDEDGASPGAPLLERCHAKN